jgi:AmmeMemoRadiSam system protein A
VKPLVHPSRGQELVELARRVIRGHLEATSVEASPELMAALPQPAGVFVTIRRTNGDLRGCVGTQHPVCPSVAEEVVRVAPLAAFSDPRFPPIAPAELDGLHFEVSILTPPEPVADPSELDPERYGATMEDARGRRALLLPAIPGIETVDRQLYELRRKAGIEPGASVRLQRFEVIKFEEEWPRMDAAGQK